VNFTRNWKGLALMYVIACSVLVLPAPALAVPQTAADNTKVNAPDKQKTQKTADQQDNNRADVDITRQIRKAIVADKSLSTNAHNIKIITADGVVTLKGPVQTDTEKSAIEKMAAEVAGAGHVQSQISVTDSKASTHRKSSTKTSVTPKPKVS